MAKVKIRFCVLSLISSWICFLQFPVVICVPICIEGNPSLSSVAAFSSVMGASQAQSARQSAYWFISSILPIPEF